MTKGHQESPREAIDRLAHVLLKRYRDGALAQLAEAQGDGEDTAAGHAAGHPDAAGAQASATPRVVFILGAGASIWSDMPLWNSVKRRVVEAAEEVFPAFPAEACRKLEMQLGHDGTSRSNQQNKQALVDSENITTDMLCSVACEIDLIREQVLKKLRASFTFDVNSDAGPPPQLGYELLAHLLKHGFADHAITFNFDDILSAAIENELGRDEFTRVSPDDVAGSAADETGYGIPKPHLVEIHGSISRESSLRFTRDDTGVLTWQIKESLQEVLFQDQRPLHLISLGYSWADQDFATWICNQESRIASLTVVIKRDDDFPTRLQRFEDANTQFHVLVTDHFVRQNQELSIDHLIWLLWERLKALHKAGRSAANHGEPELPTAARHKLLGYLFGPKLDDSGKVANPGSCDYLNRHQRSSRFKAELLLHAVKCQGMVNASVMARDTRIRRYRPGDYAEFDEAIRDLFAPGDFPEVRETLFCDASSDADFAAMFSNEKGFALSRVLIPTFDTKGARVTFVKQSGMEFIEEQVERILQFPEIEIDRSQDPRVRWMFQKPGALLTYPDLYAATTRITESSWTDLFVIAETGEWISRRDPLFSRPCDTPRDLYLLAAALPKEWRRLEQIDDTLGTTFKELKAYQVALHRGHLSWWQHNRHLTLAYKRGDHPRDDRFVGAIFFWRPNRASRISPVELERQEDCVETFLTFLSYVRRGVEEQLIPRLARRSGDAMDDDFVDSICEMAERVAQALPEGLTETQGTPAEADDARCRRGLLQERIRYARRLLLDVDAERRALIQSCATASSREAQQPPKSGKNLKHSKQSKRDSSDAQRELDGD